MDQRAPLLQRPAGPARDGQRAAGGAERPFRAYDAGGYEVLLDMGGRRLPDELVLELRGRRRSVVAFWNDQAWVG